MDINITITLWNKVMIKLIDLFESYQINEEQFTSRWNICMANKKYWEKKLA